MDTGTYRMARVTDPGTASMPPSARSRPSTTSRASQPAAYPHFFVVKVRYADLASPQHVTCTEYLLFAQASPGGPWKDVIEPNVFSAARACSRDRGRCPGLRAAGQRDRQYRAGSAPRPRQIQPDTISWLDSEAAAGADPAEPGSLADLRDVIFWRDHLPSGTVTDTHSPAPARPSGCGPTAAAPYSSTR